MAGRVGGELIGVHVAVDDGLGTRADRRRSTAQRKLVDRARRHGPRGRRPRRGRGAGRVRPAREGDAAGARRQPPQPLAASSCAARSSARVITPGRRHRRPRDPRRDAADDGPAPQRVVGRGRDVASAPTSPRRRLGARRSLGLPALIAADAAAPRRHRRSRPCCCSCSTLVLAIAADRRHARRRRRGGRRLAARQLVLRPALQHAHDRRVRERDRARRVRRRGGHRRVAGRRPPRGGRSKPSARGSRRRRWPARRPAWPPIPTRCPQLLDQVRTTFGLVGVRITTIAGADDGPIAAAGDTTGDTVARRSRSTRRRPTLGRPELEVFGGELSNDDHQLLERARRPAGGGDRQAPAGRGVGRGRQAGRHRRRPHGAAARRLARPAHAAGVDQGDDLGPARPERRLEAGAARRGARHDRGGDRPAQPARRQPARRQPAADRGARRRPRGRRSLDTRDRGGAASRRRRRRTRSTIRPVPDDGVVLADAALLERSLDNVVRNALRHAPDGHAGHDRRRPRRRPVPHPRHRPRTGRGRRRSDEGRAAVPAPRRPLAPTASGSACRSPRVSSRRCTARSRSTTRPAVA